MNAYSWIMLFVLALSADAQIIDEISVIEFTAAFCYDTDADGFIDSIVIDYRGNRIEDKDSALIMEKITLPASRNFTLTSFSSNDSCLILRVQENRDIPNTSISNQDRIEVEEDTIPDLGLVRGRTIILRDRVAPVIISARLRKHDIGDDTLTVTFSEPVQSIPHLQPFYFSNQDGVYSVTLESVGSGNSNVYRGVLRSQSGPTEQNDLIWINETASVMDVVGVEQNNPQNRKVPLQVDFGNFPVRFTDAFYFDRDADGFIDEIRLYYTGSLDYWDRIFIKDKIVFPGSRNLGLIGDPVSGTDGILILRVEENSDEPRTNILPGDSITFIPGQLPGDGYLMPGSLKIKDRMAPVIRSAHLDSYGNGIDTLRIVFSEPVVEFLSIRPFRLMKPDSMEYEILMYENAVFDQNNYTGAMRSVLFGRELQEGDLIWLQVLTVDVYDLEGNLQKAECNRRVILSIDYHFSWRVLAENNPYTKGKRQMPEQVRDAYRESGKTIPEDGVVIIVEPDRNIREKVPVNGTVSIYDAVNNIVIKKQKLIMGTDQTRLFYVWDGTNYNGRKAGSGTYLGIVRVVYNNKEYKKPINLGIKR